MRYFLKKSVPSKKGVYLQIYQSCYVPGKGGRNKSFKAIGYVDDLIAQGIDDPYFYAQNLVDELNKEMPNKLEKKISDSSYSKNLGYFLIKSMFDYLEMDEWIALMSNNMNFHFRLSG